MENSAYFVITYIVSISAALSFIFHLTTTISQRRSLTFRDYVCYVLFLAGSYLLIPCTVYTMGLKQGDVNLLTTAARLSINNYEKRLCWHAIADIYTSDRQKDGKIAIENLEKAINDEYKKYPKSTEKLAYLYIVSGNISKAIEVERDLTDKRMTPVAYAIKGDYRIALKNFPVGKMDSQYKFLRSTLNKTIGEYGKARADYNEAQRDLAKENGEITDPYLRSEHTNMVNQFKSIPQLKAYLAKERREYNF